MRRTGSTSLRRPPYEPVDDKWSRTDNDKEECDVRIPQSRPAYLAARSPPSVACPRCAELLQRQEYLDEPSGSPSTHTAPLWELNASPCTVTVGPGGGLLVGDVGAGIPTRVDSHDVRKSADRPPGRLSPDTRGRYTRRHAPTFCLRRCMRCRCLRPPTAIDRRRSAGRVARSRTAAIRTRAAR
jgi:hypothetical protein